ncbi:MAG: hypothetical protein HWN80_12595 [Candidatus Lokiarchaeota archaeon]|nr:hypothetical protein [Candidatus Lokiarchaeota archaeon]
MRYYWETSMNAGYNPDKAENLLDASDLKNLYEIKTILFDIIIYYKH